MNNKPFDPYEWRTGKDFYKTPAEQRYAHDPIFKSLTDTLYNFLENQGERQFTPTELREASMLAAMMWEWKHIRPLILGREPNEEVPNERL